MGASRPVRLFYSYSHKDERFREELEAHLSLLRRNGVISEWHDRKITPGTEWREEIDKELEVADVIVLLISADFLASDFCYEEEMGRALDRHARNEAVVVPIILRPVDFHSSPFASLQALPTDAKPVTLWEDRDLAWLSVVRGIRSVCESHGTLSANSTLVVLHAEDLAEVNAVSEDDYGLLDFNALLEERMEEATEAQELLGTTAKNLSEFFKSRNAELEALRAYQGRDKARRARDVSRSLALRLSRFAEDLDALATSMRAPWEEVTRYFPKVLAATVEDDSLSRETRAEILRLLETIAQLEGTLEGARVAAETAAEPIRNLGKHSADLKFASRRASASLERVKDGYWAILSILGQLKRQIQDHLDIGDDKPS